MSELALIFDLDGVIVNSNAAHAIAWRQYLGQFGINSAEMERNMYGKRNDDLVREIFGHDLSPEDLHRHGAAKESVYRDIMRPRLEEHLVPGVRGFLQRWKQSPMGVASNAERPNVDFVLNTAGLADYFRVTIDGHQVARPKPDPAIYLLAADLLGKQPGECIVFEDSVPGVLAACAAGMRVVGLQTTHETLTDVSVGVDDFLDPRLEAWLLEQKALP